MNPACMLAREFPDLGTTGDPHGNAKALQCGLLYERRTSIRLCSLTADSWSGEKRLKPSGVR